MKKILPSFVIAALIFSSCSDSTESQVSEPVSTENSMTQTMIPAVNDSPTQAPPAVDNGMLNTPPPPNAAPAAPVQTATAPGMNPPHGQPGHRCDINVGAPLNSAPNTPPAPAPTPSLAPAAPGSGASTPSFSATPLAPVTAPPAAPAAPATATKTAPGMNPPHGEPGHDCTIAVGAPLKK